MENKIGATNPAGGTHIEQGDIMQLLQDHEATTMKLGKALRARETEYQQLHAKYEALRSGVINDILGVSGAPKTTVESYILVLVDAQSHQFRENYAHGAESGGMRAAGLLKNAITEHCNEKQRDVSSCRTVVRVYANLKKLSVDCIEEYAAKKPGFTKPAFPRGLGAFAAGFSHDDASMDYVDVASDAAVERKICGLFETSIKDSSCDHVFFGASGSAQYARVLREHLMYAEKITLIQRGVEDTSLMSLGLQSVIFSEVFGPLDFNRAAPGDTNEPHKNIESDQSSNHTTTTNSTVGSNQKKAFRARSLETRSDLMRSRSTFLAALPLKGPPGTIPVNAAGHRIDMHMNTPTQDQWDEYAACVPARKLCDVFHLGQGCNNDYCGYDHNPVSFNERYCHRFMRRVWPCRAGGTCRDIYCFRGHICHCEISKNGKFLSCKMSKEFHGIDRRVEKWVKPDKEDQDQDQDQDQDENSSGGESRTKYMPSISMIVGNLIDV